MTIFGIVNEPKTNKLPSNNFEGLPLPIVEGNLAISLSFEGFPSGSLTIANISSSEITRYREAYGRVGTKFTLFDNLYMEVASYSETEDLIQISNSSNVRSYNVSVNLRSGNSTRAGASVEVRSKGTKNKVGDPINLTIDGSLSVANVASRAGLSYNGFTYNKKIPKKSANFSTNFQSLLSERLRTNLSIVDWTNQIVRTKNYRAGADWEISTNDIIYAIDVAREVPNQYRNTVLSGEDNLPFNKKENKKSLIDVFGRNSKRKNPSIQVTEEGDIRPLVVPADVRKLRGIDMNFDFSGPRKTRKVTTTKNGQPFMEEIFTYGLAYLAQDIRNIKAETETSDISIPALKSDDPNDWWRLIEYQKTEYIYKSANVTASVIGKDSEGKRYRGQVVGSSLFNSTYLTEINTTGWKLGRFQQEQFDEFGTNLNSLDSRWLTDEIALLENKSSLTAEEELDLAFAKEQLKSITFKRFPYRSRTQYHLVPANSIYKNVEQTPFQTQFVDKEEIGVQGTGKVLVAIPDPSYVFPMKVLEERTLVQSFDQMDHPENIFIRDDRRKVLEDNSFSELQKREALKDLKLIPWLTTGEDTYRATLRQVLPSKNTKNAYGTNRDMSTDLYLEFQSNASHNDHKFQYSLQEKVFTTTVGQLPDATVFNYEFEDEKEDDEDEGNNSNFEYRISTTSNIEDPILSESLQYETNSLNKALAIAKCELELDNFLSSYEINLNLAWFYPSFRPGDYITILDDPDKDKLRIKNISFSINYQGFVNGEILKTSDGTNVTCGVMPDRQISLVRVNKDSSNGDDDLDIKTNIEGSPVFGLSISPNIRTRRNPSADQIEEETGRFI